jgi:alpha-D-ribose 1-methylphosphonate 5-phosphate C-P lyase
MGHDDRAHTTIVVHDHVVRGIKIPGHDFPFGARAPFFGFGFSEVVALSTRREF